MVGGRRLEDMMQGIARFQTGMAAAAMLTAALLAHTLAPHELLARTSAPGDLEDAIPRRFGDWSLVPDVGLVTPNVAEADGNDGAPHPKIFGIYSQLVERGYRNSHGDLVMLMVAYGPAQDFQSKAHRPEFCYVASGFRILDKSAAEIAYRVGAPPLKVMHLTAVRGSRMEPVSYWMRVGDKISIGAIDRQLIRLAYGLRGIVPDGALIRVSTLGLNPRESFEVQNGFVRDLFASLRPTDLKFFTGTTT
jgi:EpsI family protein